MGLLTPPICMHSTSPHFDLFTHKHSSLIAWYSNHLLSSSSLWTHTRICKYPAFFFGIILTTFARNFEFQVWQHSCSFNLTHVRKCADFLTQLYPHPPHTHQVLQIPSFLFLITFNTRKCQRRIWVIWRIAERTRDRHRKSKFNAEVCLEKIIFRKVR